MQFDGERLKDLRLSKGLNLDQVAVSVGKTRQAVGNWEKGVHEPKLSEMSKLGKLLGVNGMFFIRQVAV